MASRPEEYIAELDAESIDPESRIRKLKQNQYYQKLQKEIAESREKRVVGVDDKQDAEMLSQKRPKSLQFTLKQQFKWGKDEEGQYQIEAEHKPAVHRSEPISDARTRIAHFLGYKIDVSTRTQEYMEKYQKYFIECRSPNFLLSKFSQLKFGMIQMVLGYLGVSSEELKKLQKKAITAAKEENEILFAQNEYNTELLIIFGAGKKDKAKQMILKETREQLIEQMTLLGEDNYYTTEKLNAIKTIEVKKILQELLQEQQMLQYMRDYLA